MLSPERIEFFDRIYYDPTGKQGSFSEVRDLLLASKKLDPKVTTAEVKQYLRTNKTYSTHKRILRRFNRRKFLIFWPNELFQADVVYLSSLAKIKKGGKSSPYAFILMDLFSRKISGQLMRRKTPQEALKAFKLALKDFGVNVKPHLLHLDQGNVAVIVGYRSFYGIMIFYSFFYIFPR